MGYDALINAAKHLLSYSIFSCVETPLVVKLCRPLVVQVFDALSDRLASSKHPWLWNTWESQMIVDALAELREPTMQQSRCPDVERLKAAWQRVERTGVLEIPRVQEEVQARQHGGRLDIEWKAGLAKAAAAPGLRTCGLASCGARETHPSHFKSCAACRIPVYCCKEHQTEHWPAHKAACKAARKAAAERADG